jgi:hypothetical protein
MPDKKSVAAIPPVLSFEVFTAVFARWVLVETYTSYPPAQRLAEALRRDGKRVKIERVTRVNESLGSPSLKRR